MKLRDFSPTQLQRLNSITKYPSIPTYHEMGERGRLKSMVTTPFLPTDEIVVTEKIDGTNVRVIFMGDSFIIGSREELLYASGDLLANPQLGIVDAMLPRAQRIRPELYDHSQRGSPDAIDVFYGELYGGKIGKHAKQYTGTGEVGFRVFDIMSMHALELSKLLHEPREVIARWRQGGGQHFWENMARMQFCNDADLAMVPLLGWKSPPPDDIEGALAWMDGLLPAVSAARMDDDAPGHPEGVVIRTADRNKIAKLRVEDYQRTLGLKRRW